MNYVRIAALVLGMAGSAGAGAAPVQPTSFDAAVIAANITTNYEHARGSFSVPTAKAVKQMDDMLMQQYGATGRISGEPNAQLKSLYYEGATLLLNGYPIAGGTVISFARGLPAASTSQPAHALGSFVDAMLQPTGEEDADLITFQHHARAGLAIVAKLPAAARMAGQVLVLGLVYDDKIAIDAAETVLRGLQLSDQNKATLNGARIAGEGK